MATDCTPIRDDLTALLDGALEAARAREVEAHLEACAACEAERRALAAAWSALDLLPGAEVRPGFLAQLEARILEDAGAPAAPVALRALEGGARRANRGVQRWLAAAAAALLAAGAGLLVLAPAWRTDDVAVDVEPDRPAPATPPRTPGQPVPPPSPDAPPVLAPRRPDAPTEAAPAADPLQGLPAEERDLVMNLELLRDLQELDELGLLDAAELFDELDAEEFDEG